MENTSPLVIFLGACGIAFLAVGLPLGIYFSIRQKRGPSTGEVIQRAGRGARQPWSREDEDLATLSDKVAHLKDSPGGDHTGSGDAQNQPKDGPAS